MNTMLSLIMQCHYHCFRFEYTYACTCMYMFINKKEHHVKCVIVLAKICEHGYYTSHVAGIFNHS